MEELEHLCEVQPWSTIPEDVFHTDSSLSNKQVIVLRIAVTYVGMPYEEYRDDDDCDYMELQYGETRERDFCKERDEILTAERSWQTISSVLSYMHVPFSIQDMMIEKIARCAQEMDRTAEKNWKVLCMAVKIWVTQSIGDFNSYMDHEAVVDIDQNMESAEHNNNIQSSELDHQNQIIVRTLDESGDEDCHEIVLYMVKVDDSVVEKFPSCRVCLDHFVIGSKAILTSCKHIYHQDCIINWISTWVRMKSSAGCPRPTCPMCRASLVCDK